MNEDERATLEMILIEREAMRELACGTRGRYVAIEDEGSYLAGYWQAMYEATGFICRQLRQFLDEAPTETISPVSMSAATSVPNEAVGRVVRLHKRHGFDDIEPALQDMQRRD